MATINGTVDSELLLGSLEADLILGLAGDDVILGLDGNDNINGNEGNDIINGNMGDDNVQGGQGDDILRGGKGNDLVFGDLGNDTLFGDIGADTLTGGAGADRFVLRKNAGSDVIVDFADGVDRFDFFTGFSFNDLLINQGTDINASNTIIRDNLTGEVLAILQGVNSSTITVDDFAAGNFDENYYLVRNFDIASALFNGQINSALDHYNQAGRAEGRIGAPPRPSTFNIEFDYRFDTTGFFSDPTRRNTMEAAAKVWESVIQDEFPDILTGTAFFVENPQTDRRERVVLDRAIDDLLLFVGARPLGAVGQTNDYAFGSVDAERSALLFPERYNSTNNYEPYVGSISFDSGLPFYADPTPFNLNDNPPDNFQGIRGDLFTTALHEIGHALGIGLAPAFEARISGTNFDGLNVRAINGGNPIPLAGQNDLGHVSPIFASTRGVPALLGAGSAAGAVIPTEVDLAILADVGYQIAGGF